MGPGAFLRDQGRERRPGDGPFKLPRLIVEALIAASSSSFPSLALRTADFITVIVRSYTRVGTG